ncbi:MAG: hypothetical protein IPM38_12855 [Ignavibacteria bacterium]|nr:hypothetical protein [Ignavibacteria bacterium]
MENKINCPRFKLALALLFVYLISATGSNSLYSQQGGNTSADTNTIHQRTVVTGNTDPLIRKGGSEKIIVEEVISESTGINEGNLGDYVTLKITNIQDLLDESKSKRKPLILYIDGLEVKNISARVIRDSTSKGWLKFQLKMKGAEESWLELLRRPELKSKSSNLVTISTGIEGEKEIESGKDNFSLVIYSEMDYFQFIAVSILLLLITIYLAVKTDMLREPAIDVTSKEKRPYSLALTQMAFWSYLVISSYLALYIITKEFPSITNSVLALIGISSATALGSVLINYKKISESKEKIISLKSELKAIDDRAETIHELTGKEKTPMRLEEFRDELEHLNKKQYELNDTIKETNKYQDYHCKGFVNDILSDSCGVSLYRFQIAVWTLVLGYIFIFTVWNSLMMPEFDNTLLALMGISSGTYLGFKFPEQRQ